MGPSPLYSPFSVISVCSEVSRLWFTLSQPLQHTQRHKTTRPRTEPPKTVSQNGSSQMWFLSQWWTGKYPNEDIDIAWYFTSIHGWAREGERCSFTAVSIGQLSSSTSWVKRHTHSILFQWLAWGYGLIPLVVYWNMSFVGRKEGGSTSWCEDQKEDAEIGLKGKQVAAVSWAAVLISLDFIHFLPLI